MGSASILAGAAAHGNARSNSLSASSAATQTGRVVDEHQAHALLA
jgi:hypothetical protein